MKTSGGEVFFTMKTYEVSRETLFEDATALATMAIRAVSMNGSGGFPAKQPVKYEMIKEKTK